MITTNLFRFGIAIVLDCLYKKRFLLQAALGRAPGIHAYLRAFFNKKFTHINLFCQMEEYSILQYPVSLRPKPAPDMVPTNVFSVASRHLGSRVQTPISQR
jgi:hypothetical protein